MILGFLGTPRQSPGRSITISSVTFIENTTTLAFRKAWDLYGIGWTDNEEVTGNVYAFGTVRAMKC